MKNTYTGNRAFHLGPDATSGFYSGLRTLFLLMILMFAGAGHGQDVFYDDFNRVPVSPGGTPLMTSC
jgi:hypothetical protein